MDLAAPSADSQFEDRYKAGAPLGRGGQARVFRCTHAASQREFACKAVPRASLASAQAWGSLASEVAALTLLGGRHPNIVRLREVAQGDDTCHVVMELCRGGSLADLIRLKGRLPEPAAKLLFQQVASALSLCHDAGVLHRDITAQNILLDRPGHALYKVTTPDAHPPRLNAKLADFGLCNVLGGGLQMTGTLQYCAPEVVQGKQHSAKADVWSLGVVLFLMLSGTLPFHGRTAHDEKGLAEAIVRGRLRLEHSAWARVSQGARDLVGRMLHASPTKRASLGEIAAHAWVQAGLERAHDN